MGEEERLVGDDGDVVGREVVGDFGEGAVVAGEDGDVAEGVALVVDEGEDVGEHFVPEGGVTVGEGPESGLDVAAFLDGLLCEGGRGTVADVDVVEFGVVGEAGSDSPLEEAVVEIDNGLGSAVVAVELLDGADAGLFEEAAMEGVVDMGEGDELRDIALSEAVDGLFAVADDEGGVSGGDTVFEEGDEILPLEAGGVLEFIDKIIVIVVADALVDEGGGLGLDDLGDALVELRDMDDFVFFGIECYELVEFVEKGDGVEVFEEELAGVVEDFAGLAQLLDLVKEGGERGFDVGEFVEDERRAFGAAEFVAMEVGEDVAVGFGEGAVGEFAEEGTGT